ncbi:hypothetical protein NFIA_094730 [Paecilomyces variotii No. 5]|uniref:Uncharacterized protein n=1 Tax=Byssochlamys spectabilis (strain No. 5 / NBRC 109023) TaxID=1356009 RepID=V5FSB4_BYSSN|nr:hypothetical protein NFIA_094730 [Paecilomyces variotii No. 5]
MAHTDGGIVIQGQGSFTESSRYSPYPVVSFEAKRRHAGGLKHASGEEEPFSPAVLAQEVGEMLGQAMTHCQASELQVQQEVSLLRLEPVHHPAETLVVFRSLPFNLKTDEGNAKRCQGDISLIRYLRSGQAKIGLLQQVLNPPQTSWHLTQCLSFTFKLQ